MLRWPGASAQEPRDSKRQRAENGTAESQEAGGAAAPAADAQPAEAGQKPAVAFASAGAQDVSTVNDGGEPMAAEPAAPDEAASAGQVRQDGVVHYATVSPSCVPFCGERIAFAKGQGAECPAAGYVPSTALGFAGFIQFVWNGRCKLVLCGARV